METHGTAIGLKCNDGILIAVEKPQSSKLLVAGNNRRVFGADKHVGVAITGVSADGRQLVNRTREEASNYATPTGTPLCLPCSRIAWHCLYVLQYMDLRPFGASALMAAYDEDVKTAGCT